MDLEKFKGEHDNMIKEMGGYAAVMRRLTIQKIYFTLNLRARRGVEHLDFVTSSKFLDFLYSVDFYTESGLSRLRIPPHSCIEYKERIISDSVYRINGFAKKYKERYPEAKVYLLYQEKGDLSDQIIRDSKKQKLTEIYQIDEFLYKVENVAKTNDRIDAFERDWKTEREMLLGSAQIAFREEKCSFLVRE